MFILAKAFGAVLSGAVLTDEDFTVGPGCTIRRDGRVAYAAGLENRSVLLNPSTVGSNPTFSSKIGDSCLNQ